MSSKRPYLIWLIPVLATLSIVLFALFTRLMVGRSDVQQLDYRTKAFVPAESPYSTGPDSR